MTRWSTILAPLVACALPLLAGCRTGIEEARFDDWDVRVAALIEQTSAAQVQRATTLEGPDREKSLQAWDAVLRALISARAAGALAYLTQDAETLESVERAVDELMARMHAAEQASRTEPSAR